MSTTNSEIHNVGLKIKAELQGHSDVTRAAKALRDLRNAVAEARSEMQAAFTAPKFDARWNRAAQDWEQELGRAFSKGGKRLRLTPKEVANRFGIDADELQNAAYAAGRKYGETFQRALRGKGLNMSQASQMLGTWSEQAKRQAMEAAKQVERIFAQRLGGGQTVTGGPITIKGGKATVAGSDIVAKVQGKIDLVIPAHMIQARVAGGGTIQATVAGSTGAAGSAAVMAVNPWTTAAHIKAAATPPPPSSGGSQIPPPSSGATQGRPGGPGVLVRRVTDRRGRTTETYINELGQIIEQAGKKSKVTEPVMSRLQTRIRSRQQAILAEAARGVDAAKGSGSFMRALGAATQGVQQLDRLSQAVASHPRLPEGERVALSRAIAAQSTKLQGKMGGLAGKAADVDFQDRFRARQHHFRVGMQTAIAAPGRTRAEAQRAIVEAETQHALEQEKAAGGGTGAQRQWRAWRENLVAQRRNLLRQQADQEAAIAKRSMADAERHAGRMASERKKRQDEEVRAERKRAAVAGKRANRAAELVNTRATINQIYQSALAEGYQFEDVEKIKFDAKRGRVTRSVIGAMEAGGMRHGLAGRLQYSMAEYVAARGDWNALRGREIDGNFSYAATPLKSPARHSGSSLDRGASTHSRLTGGGSYTSNLATVGAWSTAVWSLYGAIGLARKGLASLTETGFQTQRLEQVFSKVGGSTLELRDDVLALAAANGRAANEAMEASIQWARLGLSYEQTAEAVRVSMIAANVAELSVADTTKHLQGIMQAYSLRVSELSGVLSQMNSISNQWNVTNAEMMDGMARTASVAKQAGIPLAELMAMIGGTVGFTGQSGANIGNAIKSFATSLAKPDIKEFLRTDFGVNVHQGEMGDVKNLNQTLGDLWETYTRLTKAEQQYLLVRTARRTQASRMAAMLDAFVPIQALAINAQLNMNSAQEENVLILKSLRSGWQGVVTEMERFIALQARGGWAGTKFSDATRGITPGGISVGPEAFMRGGLQAAQNVLNLMNTPAGSTATAGLSAMLTALGLRMGISGLMGASRKAGLVRAGKMERSDLGWLSRTLYDASVIAGRGGESAALQTKGQRFGGLRRFAGAFRGTNEYRMTWPSGLEAGPGMFVRGGMMTVRQPAAAIGMIRSGAMLAKGAVASLGGAFLEMAPIIALVVGATWGFNRVMEELGFSSATANSKINDLTKAFEENQAAAQAAGQAVTLYQRLQRTLPDMTPEKRLEAAKFLSKLGGGRRSFGIDAATAKAIEEGDASVYGPALESVVERIQAIGMADRAAATASKIAAGTAAQVEAQRLRDKGQEKAAQVKDREAQELLGAAFASQSEADDADRQRLMQVPTFQGRLALQSKLVDHMGALYDSLPAATPTAAALNRAQGIMAQIGLVDAGRSDLDRRMKQFVSDKVARDERIKLLSQERDDLLVAIHRRSTSTIPGSPPGTMGGYFDPRAARDESRVAEIDAEIATLDQTKSEEQRTIESLRTSLSERREKLVAELGDASAGVAASLIQSRVRMATGDAAAVADRFSVGENATEQMLNRRAGLLQSIQQVEQSIAEMKGQGMAHEEQSVRLLEYQRQLMETNVSLGREAYAVAKSRDELVEKSQRRQQEALLGAGPGEMLQHIGAWRLTHDRFGRNRQVGVGEFMSWSPRMRELAGIWNPALSAEGRSLNRRMMQASGIDRDALREENLDLIGRQARTVRDLQDPWVEALGASRDLSGFRTSVTNAGMALEEFVQRVESLLSPREATNQNIPGAVPPVLSQGHPAGGVLGGIMHAVAGAAVALRQ